MNILKNTTCSKLEFDNWILSDWLCKKLIPIVGTHPFPVDELLLMVRAIAISKPKLVFDWGTHIGKSARIFYEVREFLELDFEIHSCDLPDDVDHVEHPGSRRGAMVEGLEKVFLHQGDGVQTSIDVWKENGKPDSVLFFCDGDHSFESVQREIGAISESIPTATMLFHDSFMQDEASGYNVGPAKAVAEFLDGQDEKYMTLESALGLPGMIAVFPK